MFAGTINLGAPLRLRVRAVGEGTLLAEIVRLMELAEQRRSRFVAIADRVARAYAPVVHGLALLTFLGWTLTGAAPWQTALLYAIAVLIITCPCALGLAVPAVQVLASGRLLRRGTLLKSATALERFARADMVVFDKTGTLTTGRLELVATESDAATLMAAAGMAKVSRHPLARALAAAVPDAPAPTGVEEIPGCGLRVARPEGEWRLGRRDWAAGVAEDEADGAELWLARPGSAPVRFGVRRPAAGGRGRGRGRAAAARLSGGAALGRSRADGAADRGRARHRRLAGAAARRPARRLRLEAWAAEGRRVLMVGDGLNDAPALAAAYVSLSPSNAVDIAQTAADAVFQGARLAAGAGGDRCRPPCRAPREAEFRAVVQLQYPGGAVRDSGLRHAADRGAGDVQQLDHGRAQLAAPRPERAAAWAECHGRPALPDPDRPVPGPARAWPVSCGRCAAGSIEDLDGAAERILFDDEDDAPPGR